MANQKTLQVYTQSEAADRLGWSRQRLHKALTDGRIVGVRTLGGATLIPRRVVERLAETK